MYTDESGDTGMQGSPVNHFILTGIVVHELRWRDALDQLVAFRRRMRALYGLKIREEIHASELISKPGPLARIKKSDRLAILRAFAKELGNLPDISIINVVMDKSKRQPTFDVFANTWPVLIQRFENTMSHRNFPGPRNADERGMILPDRTDDKKLTQLVRRMRAYNPISNQVGFGLGSRDLKLKLIIEDPVFRDSQHSYFVQACDTCAYLLRQHLAPNQYMRRHGGHNYFRLLSPVLCKVASTSDPLGIVRL
ncbi:MAG: DUF3800 domain-containing protein [Lacipirellulaceae bacterium]